MKNITIRIDEDVYEAMKVVCKETGMKNYFFIGIAVKEKIERIKNDQN